MPSRSAEAKALASFPQARAKPSDTSFPRTRFGERRLFVLVCVCVRVCREEPARAASRRGVRSPPRGDADLRDGPETDPPSRPQPRPQTRSKPGSHTEAGPGGDEEPDEEPEPELARAPSTGRRARKAVPLPATTEKSKEPVGARRGERREGGGAGGGTAAVEPVEPRTGKGRAVGAKQTKTNAKEKDEEEEGDHGVRTQMRARVRGGWGRNA